VFATQPTPDLTPRVVAEVGEGAAGHAGPEVGAPALERRVELTQKGIERLARVHCPAHGPDLAGHGLDGLAGGVGVDVVPGGAPLAVALDAPAEKVEALVDVGDQGLVRRQAQAHRGQNPGDLLPEGFGVIFRPCHHQAPVVRLCRALGYADQGAEAPAWRAGLRFLIGITRWVPAVARGCRGTRAGCPVAGSGRGWCRAAGRGRGPVP